MAWQIHAVGCLCDRITGMATPVRCSIRGLNVYNLATAILNPLDTFPEGRF
jgi:hypothetical protein